MRTVVVILLVAALGGSASAARHVDPSEPTTDASRASTLTSPPGPVAAPLRVVRDFAPPQNRYGRGHRGVDLAAGPGTAVRVSAPGVVLWAGPLAGRGVVSVRHGALRSTYEPVSARVSAGDEVAAGTVIGVLQAGHPGCPAEACLHWGLRTDDRYFDPFLLLGATVRLLPRGR